MTSKKQILEDIIPRGAIFHHCEIRNHIRQWALEGLARLAPDRRLIDSIKPDNGGPSCTK